MVAEGYWCTRVAGDASLSAGSAGGAGWAGGAGAAGPGAASLAGLAGSLQDASPAAASWPDDLPSTSALPNRNYTLTLNSTTYYYIFIG